MAKTELPYAHQLYSIIGILEEQLRELDKIGAGIAAVHVNAAIEQLHSNLAIVNDNDPNPFDPQMLCLIPDDRSTTATFYRHSKD
ncbi:hypothetical protein FGU71_12965 [Erythrobacter insulae]|uniref:Uncharacterized protein n=1 Tax=Erythrobacter insulae TaxID=2584124 RepID=A0A547P6Z1_9SPHN|nr:hypothetical protein [Erythrobacter insulae]TRD09912.1 hypothetical protein FGU71_12965 [Erythrobacter insulae]